VRKVAVVKDAEFIKKIFTHLDARAAESGAAKRPLCRVPPQWGLFDFLGSSNKR